MEERIDRVKSELADLTKRELKEIRHYCQYLLEIAECPQDAQGIFHAIGEEMRRLGIRLPMGTGKTRAAWLEATLAIQELMAEYGPKSPADQYSLIRDMVNYEAELLHSRIGEDFSPRHLLNRLRCPRAAIEAMYPGYAEAGLLRVIGELTAGKIGEARLD